MKKNLRLLPDPQRSPTYHDDIRLSGTRRKGKYGGKRNGQPDLRECRDYSHLAAWLQGSGQAVTGHDVDGRHGHAVDAGPGNHAGLCHH